MPQLKVLLCVVVQSLILKFKKEALYQDMHTLWYIILLLKLDVYEKPYRMIKLRNPWGEREWNGRASDSDKKFWQKINPFDKDRLGQKFQNDGTFFMLWEDFV